MNKVSTDFQGVGGIWRGRAGAWLRVTGMDALSFLQGQFTQELREGRGAAASYGLWLNQKGKVVADSWVLRVSEEECWVWSAFAAAEVIRERLEAYVIADDVVIEDATGTVESWVAVGEAGRAALVAAGVPPPAAGAWWRGEAGWVWAGRRGVDVAWEWVRPEGAGAAAMGGRAEAAGEGVELSGETLERWRIEAGVPRVPEDVGGEDLPGEAGLETVAISYTKGCYLGQEVMARLKALGRVRRRLVRVSGPGAVPAGAERELWAGAVAAGNVRTAVARAEGEGGGWVGLAMVKLLAVEGGGALRLAREAEAACGGMTNDE